MFMDAFWSLFSFQGRANRAWYFWHILLDDLAVVGLLVVLVVLTVILETPLLIPPILGVIAGGVGAAVAITVKRLHDLGRPGWHFLLFMVPLYNIYLGLVCLFQRGTLGPNQYGWDPLAPGDYALLEGEA
jgi:uncharacterized membrane protein YhaH (DUF805 family)